MNQQIEPIADRYDVIVVGARAAGAATAMLLARRGVSVLAIDRAPYGSDTLSTHSISGPGVLQLSRWALLDTIRDAGTPVTKTVVFNYGPDHVSIDVPTRGDVDGLYAPRRTLLDAALVDAARDSGADVRHGVTMVQVTQDTRGRVDGVEIDVDGSRRTIGARVVVGADGMRSRVARQVGARTIHAEPVGATSTFAYFAGLADDTIVNHYGDDRVVGVIPTNDDLAVVWTGMPLERFDRVARGRLADAHRDEVASVPELHAQLAGRQPVGGYRSFPGTPGFLRQAWGPGWALVGDAGYFKDPVSAHGITDAFIGAELLADALGSAFVCGSDLADALTHFQEQRDRMAAEMMPPVVAVASFAGDMSAVKDGFRAMSTAMRNEWQLIESSFGVLATC